MFYFLSWYSSELFSIYIAFVLCLYYYVYSDKASQFVSKWRFASLKMTLAIVAFTNLIFLILIQISLISTFNIFLAASSKTDEDISFIYRVLPPVVVTPFLFVLAFCSALALVHYLGYIFSGLLHRVPPRGKFWPKGIDYFYYVAGFVLLAQVLDRSLQQEPLDGLRLEMVLGMYLFSLKLYKTSYEIFPSTFAHSENFVRIPGINKLAVE